VRGRGVEGKGEGGKWRDERGWEGRRGREEVGAPFNFLPPGATDLVTPLAGSELSPSIMELFP